MLSYNVRRIIFHSSFFLIFFIIAYFVACNNSIDNEAISPKTSITDNGGELDCLPGDGDTTDFDYCEYNGSCNVTHVCLPVCGEKPPPTFEGKITVYGYDCNNEYFYCVYYRACCEKYGLGNRFPYGGPYTVLMEWEYGGNCWAGNGTFTVLPNPVDCVVRLEKNGC